MTICNRLASLAIGIALICAAWLSLKRVESGELFLLALSFESAPYELEVLDAISSAQQWTAPALSKFAIAADNLHDGQTVQAKA